MERVCWEPHMPLVGVSRAGVLGALVDRTALAPTINAGHLRLYGIALTIRWRKLSNLSRRRRPDGPAGATSIGGVRSR
jgi:hypothetical protein